MKTVRTVLLTATLLAASAGLLRSHAAHIEPDEFKLRCKILDPVTRLAVTQVSPGGSVLVTGSIRVGSAKFGNPLKVVANAQAKVVGVNLNTRIGDVALELPIATERTELLGSQQPTEYANKFSLLFTVPTNFPPIIASVEVVATIPGIAERTCSKSLEVL
jgi:hypothetical protein